LVDLIQLVTSREEIEDYRKAYDNNIDQKLYSKDVYENAKIFLSKDEKIFITDMNKRTEVDNIYFNDIAVDVPVDLKEFILSLNYYGNDAFDGLVRELNIKCLSHQPKEYSYTDILDHIDIDIYRDVLHFAYDVLFTKYYDQYKELPGRKDELRKINDITAIILTSKIKSNLIVKESSITLRDEKFYINTDTNDLVLVDKKYISKAIANILGSISDKDLKDFIDEVIEGDLSKNDYYLEEGVKEKQDFYLEISDNRKEHVKHVERTIPAVKQEVTTDDTEYPEEKRITQLTPQEEQERLRSMSPLNQIKTYENDGDDTDSVIEPMANGDLEAKRQSFLKKIKEKTDSIRKKRKIETKPRRKRKEKSKNDILYRAGEEETKAFFRRKDQYAGHCQICGFTFKIRSGPNYCERFTWTDSRKNSAVAEIVYPGNSLCLCGKCYSIINGGGDFHASFLEERVETDALDDFIKKFHGLSIDEVPEIFEDHIEFYDMYSLPIRLNKKEEYIYFTEDHLIEFFAFLNEDIEN
jgi:hypothetical protein